MSLLNRRRALLETLNFSGLPSRYQEVEYIESTGTQYIDTGTVASNNSRIIIDFTIGAMTQHASLIGARGSTTVSRSFNIWYMTNLSGLRCDYNNTDSASTFSNLSQDTRYEVDFNKNVATLGNLSYSFRSATFTTPYNIIVFSTTQGKSVDTRRWKGKLYRVKIYDDDTLIRDFIPCYRKSDDVIGLYDLKNGVFYDNDGTGTFLKGADVNN